MSTESHSQSEPRLRMTRRQLLIAAAATAATALAAACSPGRRPGAHGGACQARRRGEARG